jgi:hypothetical protein
MPQPVYQHRLVDGARFAVAVKRSAAFAAVSAGSAQFGSDFVRLAASGRGISATGSLLSLLDDQLPAQH